MAKKSAKLPPIHPGETILEDFMKPLKLSANRLAIELHVPVTRINDIIHGRRSITADTALRLARYFRMSPEFWINLQAHYDLEKAMAEAGKEIEDTVRPRAA
jgi:addiction module HigA family antidote